MPRRNDAPRDGWLRRTVRSLIKDAILIAVVFGVAVWLISRTTVGANLLWSAWHGIVNGFFASARDHKPHPQAPHGGSTAGHASAGGPATSRTWHWGTGPGGPALRSTTLVPRGLRLGMTQEAFLAGAGRAWYRTDGGMRQARFDPSRPTRPYEPYVLAIDDGTMGDLAFFLASAGTGGYGDEPGQRRVLRELAAYAPGLRPDAMERTVVDPNASRGRRSFYAQHGDPPLFAYFRGDPWVDEVHLVSLRRMRELYAAESRDVQRQLLPVEAHLH